MPLMPPPTPVEQALLERSLLYDSSDLKFERIKGTMATYPTVHMFTRKEKSELIVQGKCVGLIDESAEIVLAWLWHTCSYERMRSYRRQNGNLKRSSDGEVGRRSQVEVAEYKTATGFANRIFVTCLAWSKLERGYNGNEAYAIAFEPFYTEKGSVEDAKMYSSTHAAVLASSSGLYVVERVAARITNLTYVLTSDVGGLVPKWLMKSLNIYALTSLIEIQEKYRRVDKVVDKVSARASICGKLSLSMLRAEQYFSFNALITFFSRIKGNA